MKSLLDTARKSLQKRRKQVENLKKKIKRRDNKIRTLQGALDDLRKTSLVSAAALHHLQSVLPPDGQAVMDRLKVVAKQKSRGKGTNGIQYPEDIRQFAITLHYYSVKGYEHVNKALGNCLPGESTIRGWYAKLDGSPGFTKESFEVLEGYAKNKSAKGEPVKVCVLMDGMYLRKHVDGGHAIVSGYTNCGEEFPDMGIGKMPANRAYATQALVIMVVGISDAFKLPVGYFLINSVTAEEQASLLRTCFCNLHDVGVDVECLTFDGLATNISTGVELGAWLYPQCYISDKPLKTSFPHPSTGKPVNIMQDACHVLKLARNALGDLGTLIDGYGREVKWSYVEELQKIQLHQGLYLANKLKVRHIMYKKNRQNTSVAAQTLSGSTADALAICRDDLKLPQFQGSEGTEEYLRKFDRWFDANNSRERLVYNILQLPALLKIVYLFKSNH